MAVLALACSTLAPLDAAHGQGRQAAFVLDANSGAVLHDSAADQTRYPASLTKMMTLYLVFEQIEQGRLTYASKIKISANAASVAPTKLDLEPGQEITVIEAIKALITKSANDVAVALAEHIAGSEGRFAVQMSERARQIGMKNSVFRNASGLPDAAQVTTARDMITLALRLQDDFPRHYALFQTKHFTHQGASFRNHNALLFNYEGTDGIKTGYTRLSGFNLVASVRRDGKHVIGAVFGGTTASMRDAYMRVLLTRALAKASTEKTRRRTPALVARGRPVPMPVPAARPRPDARLAVAPELVRAPAPVARSVQPAVAIAPPIPVEIARGRLATGTRVTSGGEGRTRATAEVPSARSVVTTSALSPVIAANDRSAPAGTLQAQAERLAHSGAQGRQAPIRLATGPAPVSAMVVPAASAHALEIQVGAYATSTEAERQLAIVRQKAGGLLRGNRPVVAPLVKERPLYRARFAGFDTAGAATACTELRRLGIDCFVLRAQ